jgi:hypothetical protein
VRCPSIMSESPELEVSPWWFLVWFASTLYFFDSNHNGGWLNMTAPNPHLVADNG